LEYSSGLRWPLSVASVMICLTSVRLAPISPLLHVNVIIGGHAVNFSVCVGCPHLAASRFHVPTVLPPPPQLLVILQ
jgi:hypothetical protein